MEVLKKDTCYNCHRDIQKVRYAEGVEAEWEHMDGEGLCHPELSAEPFYDEDDHA